MESESPQFYPIDDEDDLVAALLRYVLWRLFRAIGYCRETKNK
jgi:hypothetical protein